MSMIFRLMRVMVGTLFRSRVDWFDETAIHFRVWPTDIDVLRHMNNGKYFSLMDLARIDLMMRCGFMRATQQRGWYPVIASEMIRFKQSLRPFARFEIRTQLLGWNERYFYLQQVFVSHDEPVAMGLVRVRFLSKKGGTVNTPAIITAIAPDRQSPVLPDYVHHWQEAEQAYTATIA